MLRKSITITFLILIVVFAGCKKETSQAEKDKATIEQYATDNNLNGTFTESGLYYVIHNAGTGAHPGVNSNITIGYKGYFLSGEIFDQNSYATFQLSGLIKGWQEGIPLVGKGGDITLLIPSNLAYNDGVRAFDIKLYQFSK
jgi:FKBP-type peptidyl-prolyl cis-trans isomerase FkpA